MKDFPLQFIQIPAFTDNYIWMIVSKDSAWVVDPGDSAVVIDILKDKKLRLEDSIFIVFCPIKNLLKQKMFYEMFRGTYFFNILDYVKSYYQSKSRVKFF